MTSKRRSIAVFFWVSLAAIGQFGCGGSGGGVTGGVTGPPPNPPTLQALSPNSGQQGGPAFTLSVVGSNFLSGATVQWNGSAMPTTVVNGNLVTANIPANAVAAASPDAVTVVNPAPGGGTSGPLDFAVPCVIPSPAPAAAQTKARVGAYYSTAGPVLSPTFTSRGCRLGLIKIASRSLHGSALPIMGNFFL